MHQIRIEVSFDSGHRLLDYQGKCAFPHGHTYRAEVFLEAPELDATGLVFDFTELRSRIKSWIDSNWDHAFLANAEDAELIAGLELVCEGRLYLFEGQNPSAEVMSRELYRQVWSLCGMKPAKVRLWESDNQYAEFREGD